MIEENVEFITSTRSNIVLLENIDLNSYDYGVKVCMDEACESSLIVKVETDEAVLPLSCQESN